MKRLRTRVREVEAKLAALEERQGENVADAAAVYEALRTADQSACFRLNGVEDQLIELQQRLAQLVGR